MRSLILVLAAGLLCAVAQAAPQCTVALPSSLDFGLYSFSKGSTLLASISVACESEAGSRLQMTLGSNLYPRPSSAKPTLLSGQDTLEYDLFIGDQNTRFGSAVYRYTFDFAATPSPPLLTVPLFGKVDPGQWKPAGRYGADVEITVDFTLEP